MFKEKGLKMKRQGRTINGMKKAALKKAVGFDWDIVAGRFEKYCQAVVNEN